MIIYIVFSTISNIIRISDTVLVGFVMNIIQKEGVGVHNIKKIVLLLSLFLVAEIIFWMFHGTSRVLEFANAFIVRKNYKMDLLQGVMNLPLEWHTDHHSGDTIDKIEKGTKSLFDFGVSSFMFITSIVAFVSSLIALIYFNVLIGAISLILSLVIFKIIFFFDAKLIPGYKIVNKNENTVSEKVYDGLSNISTLVILKIQNSVIHVIKNTIGQSFVQFNKNNKISEFKWFLVGLFGRLIVVISVVLYIVTNYHAGTVLIGSIYMIYNFSDALRKVFQNMAYFYSQLVVHQTAIYNSEELSDYFTGHIPEMGNLPKDWKQLNITNLSFSYHGLDATELHVDNVSFPIRKAERIAIIGESGGGKSTVLKLIRDLYHPKKVTLSVDNNEIKNQFLGISNSVSLIPQDPEIFATTVRENITMGIDYSDAELYKFIQIGCFDEVIGLLPKGVDSSLVEKGVNLSGGQKQRLALVRGLIASIDKEIILLDEPTSSVDMINEINIYKNIFREFSEKTIISSVHKMYLLPLFDTIYFFKSGKIIASGSFEELKQNSLEFQNLLEKQDNLE